MRDNRFKLVEIADEDKEAFFIKNYPFGNRPNLTDRVECIHCGRNYPVSEYKLVKSDDSDFLYISCAYAPGCDGTIIDWFPFKQRLQKDIHKVFSKYTEFFSDTIYDFKGKKVKKLIKELKVNRFKTMRKYFKFVYDMDDTYVVVDELYPDHVVHKDNVLSSRSDKLKNNK